MRRDEKPLRRVNPGGDVRWVARCTVGGRRGSHGTFAKCGPCKAPLTSGECCAQHRIWWAYEQDAPGEAKATAMTIRGYFGGDWLKRHPRVERTEKGYKSRIKAMLDVDTQDGLFGELPIRETRPRHLDDLVGVMLCEHGRVPSGVRAVIGVISAMFKDAIRDDLAEMNPAAYITVRDNDPRAQRHSRPARLATWDEMHRFAACAGEHEPLILLMSDCGLRLGEALAPDCRHVNGDTLTVERHAWHGSLYGGLKSGESRETPIPPRLAGLLAAAKRDRIGLLFPDADGKVWTENAFYSQVWRPAREASGLELLPHDLRHSYVSLMRAAGVDPADLAKAAGHTVQTATSRYTHSTGGTFDVMRRAVGE